MWRGRFIFFLSLVISSLQGQDWPMYLKDLAHSSFDNPETRLPISRIATLQPSWIRPMGVRLASGATLSGGTLYFGDWGGNFNALDAASGNVLWRTFVGTAPAPAIPTCSGALGVSSQGSVIGNNVYVGGGDSAVYALDISTGKQQWRVQLADPSLGNYIWSSIMPYQNLLYVGIASLGDCPIVRGAVAKIDPQNPQQPFFRYFAPEGQAGGGIWSTPAIDSATNEVFVATANGDSQDTAAGYWTGAMLKLDANTLANKAFYLLPERDTLDDLVGGSSPTLFTPPGGVPMVVASAKNGIMYANRRSDMSLAWQTRLAVSCINPVLGCGAISTASFDGATLFAGAGVRDPNGFANGSVYAINPADGSTVWEQDTVGSVVAPVTVANGLVFVSTSKGLEIYDAVTGQFVWSDNKRGTIFSQPVVMNGTVYSTYFSGDVVAWTLPAAGPGILYSSSSASGIPGFAPGAIASTYSANLNGAAVTVQDSAGVLRNADLLYSGPGQVNYVIPGDTAMGRATVMVTSAGGTALSGILQIANVAPGIFSANADGKGVAAAQVLTVKSDGSRNLLPVFQCSSAPGSCVAQPIDLGSQTDQTFLTLYATGLRLRTSQDNVSCTIGGVAAPVLYAGAQNGFEGLDQVNVRIPASLRGRGDVAVTLSVDGQRTNTVKVSIK